MESKNSTLFSNTIKKIKCNKKAQYFVVILSIIIGLFVLFTNYNKPTQNTNVEDEILIYVNDLENRLSQTLSTVGGAGRVSVVITVKSGKETVLAMKTTTKENAQGKETESSPLIVNGKTVVVKELYPEIVGVLIVAEGAGNISVMNKLQQATVSLLDISVKQIEILSMK